MIDYTLPLNLGICPKCRESNVFLAPETMIPKCTARACLHAWESEEAFVSEQWDMIKLRLENSKRSLNKQKTVATYDEKGQILELKGGIEWTGKPVVGGKFRPGFTTNPLAGCSHGCKWKMPNGEIAICYAKSVAENPAKGAYPHGFEHHYWYPDRLYDGLKIPASHRIFPDSMSDMFEHSIEPGKIFCMLRAFEVMSQHDFLALTKNPRRILKFKGYLPGNLWPGFSSPPDFFMGHELTRRKQEAMLRVGFETFSQLKDQKVRWVSFEPLSWDVSKIVADYPGVINWAVIGAASNGPVHFQPKYKDVENLLAVLDAQGCKVFFKGNLDWNPMRYEFPD